MWNIFPSGRELACAVVFLLAAGAALGVGCEHGCGWIRRHVSVSVARST